MQITTIGILSLSLRLLAVWFQAPTLYDRSVSVCQYMSLSVSKCYLYPFLWFIKRLGWKLSNWKSESDSFLPQNPPSSGERAPMTISQFFTSSHCLVCSGKTAPDQKICAECALDPRRVVLTLETTRRDSQVSSFQILRTSVYWKASLETSPQISALCYHLQGYVGSKIFNFF